MRSIRAFCVEALQARKTRRIPFLSRPRGTRCALCRNSLNEGRLVKKKRCVLHLQSDEPNPAIGMEAPRSARMTRAH